MSEKEEYYFKFSIKFIGDPNVAERVSRILSLTVPEITSFEFIALGRDDVKRKRKPSIILKGPQNVKVDPNIYRSITGNKSGSLPDFCKFIKKAVGVR
jgi:hypothetical protein